MNNQNGIGLVSILGLVFIVISFSLGFNGLKPVWKSYYAKNWQPTSVQIKLVELQKTVDLDSGIDTYQLHVNYQYQWDGQYYTASQVSFDADTNFSEDYHQALFSRLDTYRAHQKPFLAWVDPNDPNNAVLIRDIRWQTIWPGLLFSLVFFGFGLGAIWFDQRQSKQSKLEQALKLQYPKQPWKWRTEWQHHEIKHSNKNALIISGCFALIWNALTLPMTIFVLPRELQVGNYAIWLVLFFTLIGVGLIYWFYINWKRWQRFKHASLTLKHIPLALGGTLQGTFKIDERLPEDTVFHVTLSSIKSTVVYSSDGHDTEETVLWQDEQHILASVGTYSTQYHLPIIFSIPADKPQTEVIEHEHTCYLWRIAIHAPLKGADLYHTYELPVFDPMQYDIPHVSTRST